MPSHAEIIVRTIVETIKEKLGMPDSLRSGLVGGDADDATFFTEIFLEQSKAGQKVWVDKMEERWNWKKQGGGDRVDWGYSVGFDYSKHLPADRIRVLAREDVITEKDCLGRILVEFNLEAWTAYVAWQHYKNLYEGVNPSPSPNAGGHA